MNKIDHSIKHYNINIVAVSSSNHKQIDNEAPTQKIGIKKIKNALDLIFSRSPFNVKWIKHLLTFGKIVIIYDPAFPKAKLASQKIAAFFPDFFQHKGHLKQFQVVIGRYGIKWPREKLAGVIVHELVGHGLQHLRGRTFYDRKIDRECEALIYEEKAYQDFKMPSNTNVRARFLRDMRHKWCADFNWFLFKKKINTDQVWGFGRPEINKLLIQFEKYIKHMRDSGVAATAVNAAKEKRDLEFEAKKIEAENRNDPDQLILIGKRYLTGLGVKKNYTSAHYWFNKAAQTRHPVAQFYLGIMFENGLGITVDKIEAYKWFSLSSTNGHSNGTQNKVRLGNQLLPSQLQKAKNRISVWKKLLRK